MLKQANNQNLQYLKDALQKLNDEQFSMPLDVLSGSTIGMHVRHILEFYRCLMNSAHTKEVDYDSRVRDASLELSIHNCMQEIEKITTFLEDVKEDVSMKLKVNYAFDTSEEDTAQIGTSLYRELQYNVEHTVHHLAIIKIGIKALRQDFQLDENFGVAASTIRNKKACAQ
ncbi:hypothetical protein [Leptobacterium sp. I13]|uniref:hypothetical protein n=1 Tax=Leptobacterium meishanense TaxID=3128904 RepID=UPI0030EE3F35